jgi:4-amino-4-deoxy-L-arabinose transferase-like glycosyltransferase
LRYLIARSAETIPRPAVPPLALLAAVVATALVAFGGRYGYHRDELYFLAAGDRLEWGYVDQGPLTPAIAGLMDTVAPESLVALRLPSALATAATVFLTGMIARELGGASRAQFIAAACTAVGAVFLTTGHLLSTTTFDLLAWPAITWICVRAIRTGDDRLWLLAGFVLGVALLNKPLPAFLAAGLLVGVAIAGPRRLLRSPWV